MRRIVRAGAAGCTRHNPTSSQPARGRRAMPALVAAVVALGLMGSLPAAAETGSGQDRSDGGPVLVVSVSGLLDPVLVSFVEGSIREAESLDAVALVLQLNSEGAVVEDSEIVELARSMRDSAVPVDVWVGPSGAKAEGAAAELVAVAEVSGMAPGTRLGDVGHQRLPEEEFGPIFGDATRTLMVESVDDTEARELEIVTEFPPVVVQTSSGEQRSVPGAPTVGDFIVNLEGVESEEVSAGGQTRREPVTVVRFSRLPLPDQLAHSVASPAVAYLLLVIGLGLFVFELYTAGVGIAGMVGAGCWVLACGGLWVLPANWWAVGLLVAAFFGFAVDTQTGVPRMWTVIGLALFIVGSWNLYRGLSLTWLTLSAGIAGALLTFYAGMPAMLRTRFSTPTIGREWMIGERGTAVVDVRPSGVVKVRDALWRAETHRATPISEGDPVRVVGIDRLVLEVEPDPEDQRV